MELRHLRYVITLSEELHFGRAAERLNISQPPLSRQIRLIENELGVQLFHRTKKEVRLTTAGQKFVDEARQVISQFNHAAQAAVRASRGEIGHIKIGTVPTQKTLITKCVRVFTERFPDVRLEFHSMCTEGQIVALQDNSIEVAFLVLPVQARDLVIEPVTSEPMLLGLPRSHPLAKNEHIPLKALAGEPIILFPRSHCTGFYDQLIKSFADAGVYLRVAYEVTNLITGLALAEAGLGLCLFPSSMSEYANDQLVFRELTPALPPVEHALGYRADDISSTLRSFISVAQDVFRQERVSVRYLRSATQEAVRSKSSSA